MKTNNFQAFPSPTVGSPETGTIDFKEDGMTMLDYFAGQALIGEIISDVLWVSLGNSGTSHEGLVKNAYNYAETMLQERAKRIGGQNETQEEKED